MTPETAHIHVEKLQNGIVKWNGWNGMDEMEWMQSDPIIIVCTQFFFWYPF